MVINLQVLESLEVWQLQLTSNLFQLKAIKDEAPQTLCQQPPTHAHRFICPSSSLTSILSLPCPCFQVRNHLEVCLEVFQNQVLDFVSEITHRFQTARPEVRQLLLQYLLPWLHNMELVDPNIPPANPLFYYQVRRSTYMTFFACHQIFRLESYFIESLAVAFHY